VRTSAAICGADIAVEDASKIIALARLDWYFARRRGGSHAARVATYYASRDSRSW
jgi:hypothetical protein